MRSIITATLVMLIYFSTLGKDIDFDPDSLLRDIRYEYEISSGYHDSKYWTMCLGTLSMTIEIPDSTEHILFCRANGPTVKYLYPPFYNSLKPLDIDGVSAVDVNIENVGADSYFRVIFTVDGTLYYSSHFAINDLISTEDLNKLHESSANFGVADEDVDIDVINGMLSIECTSDCNVEVFSVDGKTVFKRTIHKGLELPLQTGIFIVRVSSNHKTMTKKIAIR